MKRFQQSRPFYAEKFDEEEFYWKRQESAFREIRKCIEVIIFNLNSIKSLNLPHLTFHCKKDKSYYDEYQQSLMGTLNYLQIFSDSLQPVINTSSEILSQFTILRKELKDNKKNYNLQLGLLYAQHTLFNREGFKVMKEITFANQNLFGNNQALWNKVDFNKLEKCYEREAQQYLFVKDKPFVEYFGNELEKILESEKRSTKQLPQMVEIMIGLILESGMDFKGIFRFSPYANLKEIEEATRRLSVTDVSEYSVDIVACIFKCFLQKLPIHIFDTMTSLEMISVFLKNKNESVETKRELYKKIILTLPDANITLLMNICYLCNQIDLNKDLNGMTSKNLGVVLAPTIFTLPDPEFLANSNIDPNTGKEIGYGIDITTFLIEEFNGIFEEEIENKERKLVEIGNNVPQKTRSPSSVVEENQIKELIKEGVEEKKENEIEELNKEKKENEPKEFKEEVNNRRQQRTYTVSKMDNIDSIEFGKFTPGLDLSISPRVNTKQKRIVLRSDKAAECIKKINLMKSQEKESEEIVLFDVPDEENQDGLKEVKEEIKEDSKEENKEDVIEIDVRNLISPELIVKEEKEETSEEKETQVEEKKEAVTRRSFITTPSSNKKLEEKRRKTAISEKLSGSLSVFRSKKKRHSGDKRIEAIVEDDIKLENDSKETKKGVAEI